jgi:hypothetical protein
MFSLAQMMNRLRVTSERPRDIIHHTFDSADVFILTKAPDTDSLTDMIKRMKNLKFLNFISKQSDIPTSIQTLSSGEIFLQFDSGFEDSDRILVFCSDGNLIFFEENKIILADGTFKSAPNGFKQLNIFVVYFNDVYIPLIFVLMYAKNEVSHSKTGVSNLFDPEGHSDFFSI